MPTLSVCIPIFKSHEILESRARQVEKILTAQGIDYEVLFCNDDATDQTQAMLQGLATASARIRLFRNDVNRGLGYSLRRLFAQAHGEFVCYTDIDLSFQFERIGEFINLMAQTDVVVASRYAGLAATRPVSRHLLSRLYFRLCDWMLGVPIKDLGSGFILIRKRCLDNVELEANGFGIHAELHAKLARAGSRFREVPVVYSHWPAGEFSILRHGFPTLLETCRIWKRMRRRSRK